MPIIPNFPFQTLYGGNKKAAEDLLQQFEFHAHEALRTAGYTWAVVEGERWYIDPDEHIELRGVSVAFHYHQRKRILNEVVACQAQLRMPRMASNIADAVWITLALAWYICWYMSRLPVSSS